MALLDLLQQQEIKPLIARRFPLAEAKQAHELLGKGGVIGKIVLVRDAPAPESRAAEQGKRRTALGGAAADANR